MCTAISCGSFAGRNLDIDRNYGGEIIIAPKNYEICFKKTDNISSHHAIIGIGVNNQEYPLYFDAMNEKGLYAASLNYVGNAKYLPLSQNKTNLAPYELIPYILAKCSTISEARQYLKEINLVNIPFSPNLPVAELHFFIADKNASIVAEPDSDGLKIYDNPVGVLTNNPSFPIQLFNLNNFQALTSSPISNRFSDALDLQKYSHGMGALGLPGDLSSSSRFVRASFHKFNSKDKYGISKIMRLLSTTAMPEGSVKTEAGFERTEYASAVDLEKLIYGYRTYDSLRTYTVKLSEENVNGNTLTTHTLKEESEPF